MTQEKPRASLFVSYSHKDQEWYETFEEMLSGDTRLDPWGDNRIEDGEDWDAGIENAIRESRIALLLVSPSFVASDYIRRRELPRILEAARDKRLRVVWVRVRPIPESRIPEEIRRLQTFKIQESAKVALSELEQGKAAAEISAICEYILQGLEYQGGANYEFYKSVQDGAWRFGYTNLVEKAQGDYSCVFKADEPGASVAVKALVKSPLDDWKEADYTPKLEIVAGLKCPTFLRLHRWVLDREPRFLVSEYVDSVTLSEYLRTSSKPMPIDQVRHITQLLAGALAEYHLQGLEYGMIKASDLLLQRTEAGPVPRLSAYRFGQMAPIEEQAGRGFVMSTDWLTYMTPEHYMHQPLTPKSDQYSLGLLAIEMLQGAPPVQVTHLEDLDKKRSFFESPSRHLEEMCRRAPLLAGVVLKMLARNPDDRWPSMEKVFAELGTRGSIADNNRELAKASYMKVVHGHVSFYEKFYANLQADKKYKHLRKLFQQKIKSWGEQYAFLDSAVCGLLNFSSEFSDRDPTILSNTARRHAALGLSVADFNHFQKTFLRTLRESGEGNEEIQQAWKKTLKAGMDYMKTKATNPRRGKEKESRSEAASAG